MKKTKIIFTVFATFFLASCATNIQTSSGSQTSESGAASSSDEETSSESHVHNYVHHDAVAATCTTAGNEEYYTCSGCTKIFDANKNVIAAIPVLQALGHQMTEHLAVPSGCVADGNSLYYECGRCHKYFSDEDGEHEIEENSWVLPALGHSYHHHDAKGPTCTEPGNEEYYSCDNCSAVFDVDKQIISSVPVINPLGHNMTPHGAVPATCTEPGNTAYYACDRCGKFFADEEGEQEVNEDSWVISATGHNEANVYELNNEANIVVKEVCSTCGTELSSEVESVLADASGKSFAPMGYINDTVGQAGSTGFSINYTFAGSTSDWGCELFRSGNFWITAGCIGYTDSTFEQNEAQDQLCDGADGQGQDGEFSIATGWDAVTGAGNYTLSFGADGSILWYKGNNVALYFAPNHVSTWKHPGRYYDTALEFVPALLASFKANGLTINANSGIINVSFSYQDVDWGFATVKYVKTSTTTEVSAADTYGPVKVGTVYERVYPDVTGYSLHDPTETSCQVVVPAGLNNVVKTVEYDKTAVVLTLKAYTGTSSDPGNLIGTKNISGTQGTAYNEDVPEFTFYSTPETTVSGTYPADDADVNIYGYEFTNSKSVDEADYGYVVNAIPDITRDTGVYVSFDLNSMDLIPDVEDANGDWSRLFESEHYLCYTGCHGITSGARLYDGGHGNPGDYGEAWNALVSYGRTARITFAYFPNGDIKAYRDSKLVLYWHSDTVADHEDGNKHVSDFAYAFIDDVNSSGFHFSPLVTAGTEKNPNRYIKNVTVGKATDIVENAHVVVKHSSDTIFEYTTNLFNGDKFLGAQVPYGYEITSTSLDGTTLTVNVDEVAIGLTEKLSEPIVIEQKWNAGGPFDRLFNFQGEEYGVNAPGDFYREITLTNFDVNSYAGNEWRGILFTFVSNMEAVGGNNAWADKTFCLGNNNTWGTQTYPGMHVLGINTQTAEWDNADEVVVTLSRHNRLYYCTVTLKSSGAVIATGHFEGLGVDYKLDTIYLSAEFAKFTVSSVKVGAVS